MYVIEFTESARQDMLLLQRNAPQAVKKVFKLIEELKEHPRSGTGQVEQLQALQERNMVKAYYT